MYTNLNLFDQFDQALDPRAESRRWTAQAPFRPHPDYDVILLPRLEAWSTNSDACRQLSRIEQAPWVVTANLVKGGVGIRIADEWVERMAWRGDARAGAQEDAHADARRGDAHADARRGDAHAGEQQGDAHADAQGIAGDHGLGGRVAIYFWNANATKALHIGHLRDLAIGNALAAALAAAGVRVERRSLLCDIGRGMGEAIAGVIRDGRELDAAGDLPEKSDRFVGNCYASYVDSVSSSERTGDGDSLERELVLHRDDADTILDRILRGDADALRLRARVRDWVIAGQLQTLGRLGISFDDVALESQYMAEIAELRDTGLQLGLLDRLEDGTVVYATGREELQQMPLVRPDGLPTQHLRALAFWAATRDLDGMASIQVCGTEWNAHVTCRHKLVDEFADEGVEVCRHRPTQTIFHGMVTEGGSPMAAKQGAMLLDDLIDWIDEKIDEDPERSAVRSRLASPSLAGQLALGYFLLAPTGKMLELNLDGFFGPGHSLGWDLARAHAHACSDTAERHESVLEDPDYRFAAIRSELLQYQLRRSAQALDVAAAARHTSHLARWYVQRHRSPRVAHVVLSTLVRAERGLGLEIGLSPEPVSTARPRRQPPASAAEAGSIGWSARLPPPPPPQVAVR